MQLVSLPRDKPLWSQIAQILSERIANGTYPVGSTMPGEMALMEEFGVSRITVRQALDKLVSRGLIERRRGKGTLVLEPQDLIETHLHSSFSDFAEVRNHTERKLLSLSRETPPEEVAEFFGIPRAQKVVRLCRATVINDHRAAYFETYLSPEVPFDRLDDTGSLYEYLGELGFPVTSIVETVRAANPTEKDRERFEGLGEGALLKRCRQGSFGQMPVEYTNSTYRGQDYELTIRLGE